MLDIRTNNRRQRIRCPTPADLTALLTIVRQLMDSARRIGAWPHLPDFRKKRHPRTILDEMPLALCIADAKALRYVEANKTALALFGYSLNEFRGLHYTQLWTTSAQQQVQYLHAGLSAGQSLRERHWLRHREGATFQAEVTVRRITDGRLMLIVQESHGSEPPVVAAAPSYPAAETAMPRNLHGIFYAFTERGRFLHWNPNLERLSGYSADEIRQGNPLMLFPPSEHAFIQDAIHKAFSNGQIDGEAPLLSKSGQRIPVHFSALKTQWDGYTCLLGMGIDLTEWKRGDARIHFLAHHDSLTALPNRAVLDDRLNHALASAIRHGNRFAVMFLDLDGFKEVNDHFGHPIGDCVLRETARRIGQALRQSDSVGRFGGDEFLVLLPVLADDREPVIVAEKILDTFTQPIHITAGDAMHTIRISTSIGIALFPHHGKSIHELVSAADQALYVAKKTGKNRFRMAAGS